MTTVMTRHHPKAPIATGSPRPRRFLLTSLLLVASACLSACTTDQVVDTSRYWGDRLTGATIDADPSND